MTGLLDNVLGPHEWGYRDPVEGGFIADSAPFDLAETVEEMLEQAFLAGAAAVDQQLREFHEISVPDLLDGISEASGDYMSTIRHQFTPAEKAATS